MMLPFAFGQDANDEISVLAIGAHSDDIEIGCGATLLQLIERYPSLTICWVVLSAHGERVGEAARSAEAFLAGLEHHRLILRDFKDGFFPYCGAEIKVFFEELKHIFTPDLILTHYGADRHQDHRVASELTWNTFRDHLILEYEIPKFDGDLGTPNVFVPLDEATCRRKVETLLEHFGSQRGKHWFTADLFYSLMRLRGMESHAPSRYAEAFYCRKSVLQIAGPSDAATPRRAFPSR